jgi:hypothetical protein
MSLICANNALRSLNSDVIIMNERIYWAAWNYVAEVRVPSERADSSVVLIFKWLNPCKFIRIPKMELLVRSANCKHWTDSRHPWDRCYYFTIIFSVKYLFNIAGFCVPQINSLSEAHSKHIVLAPIQEIQVIIINDIWGIKNLFGKLRDAPQCLLLLLSFFLCKCLDQGDILMKSENAFLWMTKFANLGNFPIDECHLFSYHQLSLRSGVLPLRPLTESMYWESPSFVWTCSRS